MRTGHMPMTGRVARWLIPACLLLLPACSPPPIEMEITEAGGEYHVRLFHRGWFGMRSGETPCIRSIVLRDAGTGAAAWQAELTGERQCADLERFTVGRAPAGFEEKAPFVRDRARGQHGLEVRGIGEGHGDVHFRPADSGSAMPGTP